MADGDMASSSGTRRIASVPQSDAPIATSKTPTKPPRFQAISLSSSRPAELGDDALPISFDELLLVADVCLGERHPAVGPLAHGLLLGRLLIGRPRDVQLYHARHQRGVFVLLAPPLLEALHEHLDLL